MQLVSAMCLASFAREPFLFLMKHTCGSSGGYRYAVSSQLTKAVRELGERFEHRLFLTATPHNGHSTVFSALLEMLDPQRFRARDQHQAESPRNPSWFGGLKADLRRLGEAFPERIIEAFVSQACRRTRRSLNWRAGFAAYGELRMKRIANLPSQKASMAKLAFVGLQQRLLSSIAAFARTLKSIARPCSDAGCEEAGLVPPAALAYVEGPTSEDSADSA